MIRCAVGRLHGTGSAGAGLKGRGNTGEKANNSGLSCWNEFMGRAVARKEASNLAKPTPTDAELRQSDTFSAPLMQNGTQEAPDGIAGRLGPGSSVPGLFPDGLILGLLREGGFKGGM